MNPEELRIWNQQAWDKEVRQGNIWTQPSSPERIAEARAGRPRVVLTPTRVLPLSWLGPLRGTRVLCLASGGGQQGPELAAAGARVTVFDNSAAQLAQDRLVAEREGLDLRLEQGDMADLSRFPDGSFDLIVHPISNCFVAEVRPVWQECARVLREGGVLLAGFCNPWNYIFDASALKRGEIIGKYPLPYRDSDYPDDPNVAGYVAAGEPLECSHTFEDQISGQTEAGLAIIGFFEDRYADPNDTLCRYVAPFLATRAFKLPQAPSAHSG